MCLSPCHGFYGSLVRGSDGDGIFCRYPEGMEEDMIATIACDVLNGLEYLHKNDTMHRHGLQP